MLPARTENGTVFNWWCVVAIHVDDPPKWANEITAENRQNKFGDSL